jgi:hypothetical protein
MRKLASFSRVLAPITEVIEADWSLELIRIMCKSAPSISALGAMMAHNIEYAIELLKVLLEYHIINLLIDFRHGY